MTTEALRAAREAMTNVVAVYDEGIAGYLVEDAFNKVRTAIARADAALAAPSAEPVATRDAGWIDMADGSIRQHATKLGELPDGRWALTATRMPVESVTAHCRVCGGAGSLEIYTTTTAPKRAVKCFACRGDALPTGSGSRCPTPKGCDSHGCGGDCLTEEDLLAAPAQPPA